MENLNNILQRDLLEAITNQIEASKRALKSLKTEITEAQKNNKNREIDNGAILKIIVKAIKQRNESIILYQKANRNDLAHKEQEEIQVLSKYLPDILDDEYLKNSINEILSRLKPSINNEKALVGKTIGELNKKYPGQLPDNNHLNQLVYTCL